MRLHLTQCIISGCKQSSGKKALRSGFKVGLIVCSLFLLVSNAAAKQPNVLLIMADDLGFETVESYGGRSYKTPNLTRLAQEGIQFNQAYATPLCTNTRVQLMTGKYQHRHWTGFGLLNPDLKTFGHLMQEAGYSTAIAGKWQLQSYDPPEYPGAEKRRGIGMKIQEAGFDEYSLFHVAHTEDKGSRYASPKIFQNGQFISNTENSYGPDIWVDFIADYMTRKTNEERPFFMYYAMSLPHGPINPTPHSEDWKDKSKRHLQALKYFPDMVEYADYLVGKLIDKVDELGIRENTIIIFYSDNGTQWNILSDLDGEWVQGGKGLTNNLGIKVPMYVSWKGTSPEGKTNNDLVESTDFFPTLLDIAGKPGLASNEKVDGISFYPQMVGKKGKTRDSVYVHYETRPGVEKDRFHLERLALDKDFKLYHDGRLYKPSEDIYEEWAILPEYDSAASYAARVKLQKVLDSMLPYQIFDPDAVPREDTWLSYQQGFSFDDNSACIVMEAESVAYPRDESWIAQNSISGHTGSGYIRALREQHEQPTKGIMTFVLNIATPGEWIIDVRHRHDHYDSAKENGFWMKIGDQAWKAYHSDQSEKAKGWEFGIHEHNKPSLPVSAHLNMSAQKIQIAPMFEHFKLDRIVAYRSHRTDCAYNLSTPQAKFHPWFDYN
ncbi:sulfatase-like hydrolase/transferase [Agaribacter flavus]|uniref:Sulfatase-like hydrolase/transferase n=1 Tax=Agaribacter flavus TaxID=1902781 RepID=A0ABV7FPU1_9ALTE